jgi:glutamyl-tRNA synthetase
MTDGQRVVYFKELVEAFDLNRVHKAKLEKNKWFNHQHLIKQEDEDLAHTFVSIVASKKGT